MKEDEKLDTIANTLVVTLITVVLTLVVYLNFFNTTRKATINLKCPYSSYTVVSQEIKDRSYSILKLDKENNTDVFSGADGLHYSAKYVSEDIIDIEAIGSEYMDNVRIFKINLKED